MARKLPHRPLGILAIVLGLLLLLTLHPYGGNPTALFHMDEVLSAAHELPENFVVLDVPSYDGAQYYAIAKDIPLLLNPEKWNALTENPPGSYAYQRILLPLLASLLSVGETNLLPIAFLLIQLLSLLLTAVIVIAWRKSKNVSLYALSLSLSPAALLGLHFSLAEPLTILLVTLFLLRFLQENKETHQSIDGVGILLLSLLVLTREVNALFVGALLLWMMWKGKPHEWLKLLIPIGVFIVWHGVMYLIFSELPFLLSAGNRSFPGSSAMELLLGQRGWSMYTFSSIGLLLGFVLPATLWIAYDIVERRQVDLLAALSIVFLSVMWMMSPNIWGSITSIGRVITPVYPLVLLYAMKRDTTIARTLAFSVLLLGIATALGLAAIPHPYTLTPSIL